MVYLLGLLLGTIVGGINFKVYIVILIGGIFKLVGQLLAPRELMVEGDADAVGGLCIAGAQQTDDEPQQAQVSQVQEIASKAVGLE